MTTLAIDGELHNKVFEVIEEDNPYTLAYKKYEDKFDTAAKEAGFMSEEEFNEYFFNEFRPAFLEKWQKEKGLA